MLGVGAQPAISKKRQDQAPRNAMDRRESWGASVRVGKPSERGALIATGKEEN